ncbi:polyprenyl synthetase family protein [Streptomyces poonensis]|uniref:Dimethylallyltransferase n=1 Tax=Streptomyces poonensis TaxID=68255 RepID=A0A918UTF5_9ACTN|nr:polyprenyl synthetase family protein [Streptomyces poonensis]GGZ33803.1 dimethylallyltransferase [Streptomyces poonensis]GLJ89215.1 dimethylallyltransferase [Streptomyces poonensis]
MSGVAELTVPEAEARVPGQQGGSLQWARDLVAPALREAVEGLPEPERLVEGYHRGWHEADGGPLRAADGRPGGKAVRPALVLLAARAVGGTAECAVPGAVAVELVHDFTLLHDDVIDGDPLRRHRPAAWTVYGTPSAVLAGDALLVVALRTLSAVPGPRGAAALRELVAALADLMRGQSQDVAFEERARVGAHEYLAMAEGKTGALMGGACALGGLLAGASEHRVAGLREFGRRLGVAFQCVDDLLAIWGDSRRSGKPVGADLAARKKSLPVAVALAADSPAGRRLAELYERPEPLDAADVAAAARLVEEAGGRTATEREAQRQITVALRALAAAEPLPEVYRQLHSLAMATTRRDR